MESFNIKSLHIPKHKHEELITSSLEAPTVRKLPYRIRECKE